MKKDNTIKSYKIYIKTHKKALSKIIRDKGFDANETHEILKAAQNNILVRLFLNIVVIEQKERKYFLNQIALIIIISRFINLNIADSESESIKLFLNKLEPLKNDFKIDINENLEDQILKESDRKSLEKKYPQVLNKHEFYMNIANMFTIINLRRKKVIYNYAYFITMYLFISYEYKKYPSKETYELFLLKLRVNDMLDKSTINLSSKYFNSLILKTNFWLNNLKVKKQ